MALLFRSPSLCGGGLRGWVLFSVIASGFVKSAWQSRHFLSLRAVLLARRGNLIRIANDLQNAQLVKTRDCHDFANAKSRNDGVICRPEVCNASRSISKSYFLSYLSASEVSQMQSKNRDISFASLTQYDKENAQYDKYYLVIASN